ncbi:UTP--GlnB (protein PII) uridylyltransferase, GlnD [Faunimonas pinastri]|uniref:Bifunctional uridylyltransferase/uridylyl-removing enzyme n=1 Tax=Faunimonas pinastri TaxID=1855383 RepID=A0A1H9GKR4_9HYPH|nr:UTP--GlnB (protein PII) uridylyltransferase, GlnD [Faunimonas pinastri]
MSRTRHVERPVEAERLSAALNAIAETGEPTSPEIRKRILAELKAHLGEGREAIRAKLDEDGRGGLCAERLSALMDGLVRAVFDFACNWICPSPDALLESFCLAAVGGYGRGRLAPHSDIDLLFLFPSKQTPRSEKVIEYLLYILWDLGLKVGHGTRTVAETLKSVREDMTIRTAVLEARFLCGDRALFDELVRRFDTEIVAGTAREFIAAKLAERDQRHARSGVSRYLVEPQVKDGKGGQRDLQTLFWIAKYVYRVSSNEALVGAGLLSREEYRLFRRCDDFLWSVRCHLHFLANRPEERISFDVQPELARRLGYQKHPGMEAVERFMKHYFLVAKDVGDLTRIVSAELEEREQKNVPRLSRLVRSFRNPPRKIGDGSRFMVDHDRINVANDRVFESDPVNLIRFFHQAAASDLALHPDAVRLITHSLGRIDRAVQHDPEANRLFLEILTDPDHAEPVLRAMNETGVLGRFIPEFGKIVAMMQFNMYHHYTVDEHLLRSVGFLAGIESGRLAEDHPRACEVMPTLKDRTVLYVALFLHDIAKGRPEDHSTAGARVARRLCPRFGLTPQQTETVAWLVQEHLTMSITAQSRDLADRRTIQTFANVVQSLDRLKMLMILTVCDIRAVGPGVWNGWKGQLLRTLYAETGTMMTGRFEEARQSRAVPHAKARLAESLASWPEAERARMLDLHYPAYWLRVDPDRQARHAELIRSADSEHRKFAYEVRPLAFEGVTEVTLFTPDHPRLLSIIAGACAATGANIVDAQIFTTTDGHALDTVFISRTLDHDEDEQRRGERVALLIEQALQGRVRISEAMDSKARKKRRGEAFSIEPQISIENELSDRLTVVSIECLDRTGLLYDLTRGLSELNLDIASAHIATFGERAVDTFYVTDLVGHKITSQRRQSEIRMRLLGAIGGSSAAREQKAS